MLKDFKNESKRGGYLPDEIPELAPEQPGLIILINPVSDLNLWPLAEVRSKCLPEEIPEHATEQSGELLRSTRVRRVTKPRAYNSERQA